jgi:ABC-2 type transport system permease protein
MKKFLAVVKREYVQRVRTRMFIATTILLPVAMSLFIVVPALALTIDAGGPMRVVVVDGTGKIFQRLRKALSDDGTLVEQTNATPDPTGGFGNSQLKKAAQSSGDFVLEAGNLNGRPVSEAKSDLDKRLRDRTIDAYLLLPEDVMESGRAQLFRSNAVDFLAVRRLQDGLRQSLREQRLVDARVDEKTIRSLGRSVDLDITRVGTSGEERDSGNSFAFVFAIGLIMYLTTLLYGQVILGAVIEEKETRIAEILFSSVKPFTLMIGKLVGVSFVAITQLTIWGLAVAAFGLYGINVLAARGIPATLPRIPLVYYLYFILFFLLGYYIYSTLYALVGSIVTTAQEGGQLAMPIIMLLVVGFYLFLPVGRSPDSSFAFWVSMVPFFAPVTMVVRIVTQTPPFWQIALSLTIGFGTVMLLTWIASRIYRIGMLMYGKRASIPEIVRWVRQS